MSTLKRFFKDSIIYGIAAVLPRVINFLMVRVHTDALPAEIYAENTDFYIWAALFAVILTLGFETTFFRFYQEKENRNQLVGTSMLTLIGWVGIFLIVFSIFFQQIQQSLGFGELAFRLKIFMAILALDTLALVPFAYIRATGKAMHYTLIKLINVGVIIVVQLIALRWVPHWIASGKAVPQMLTNLFTATEKVEYIFIANLLGSAISLILVLPYLFKFQWKWNTQLWKKMLTYSYPIVIAGIAYVINENLDKWLLGSMIDKETEGLYAAAYKLAIFMNLYIMAFRLGAEPFFFSISGDKNAPKTYAIVMKYFVLIGSLALIAIVLLMDFFKHFINPSYWEALKIVPIVLLANLFLGIYHNLSIWYKLTDRTRFGMLFSIIGALITIGFNLYFIPRIGYMAAAWATVSAYGSMMLISFLYGKKYYPIPYPVLKISSYVIIGVAISFISFYYLNLNLLQSILLLLVIVVIYFWFERNDLKRLLKAKKV